jgi:hypothetical protein
MKTILTAAMVLMTVMAFGGTPEENTAEMKAKNEYYIKGANNVVLEYVSALQRLKADMLAKTPKDEKTLDSIDKEYNRLASSTLGKQAGLVPTTVAFDDAEPEPAVKALRDKYRGDAKVTVQYYVKSLAKQKSECLQETPNDTKSLDAIEAEINAVAASDDGKTAGVIASTKDDRLIVGMWKFKKSGSNFEMNVRFAVNHWIQRTDGKRGTWQIADHAVFGAWDKAESFSIPLPVKLGREITDSNGTVWVIAHKID